MGQLKSQVIFISIPDPSHVKQLVTVCKCLLTSGQVVNRACRVIANFYLESPTSHRIANHLSLIMTSNLLRHRFLGGELSLLKRAPTTFRRLLFKCQLPIFYICRKISCKFYTAKLQGLCQQYAGTVIVVDNLFECHTLNCAASIAHKAANKVAEILYSVQNIHVSYKLADYDLLWKNCQHHSDLYLKNLQAHRKITPLPEISHPSTNSICVDTDIKQQVEKLKQSFRTFSVYTKHDHILVSFGTACLPIDALQARIEWVFDNLSAEKLTIVCGGNRHLKLCASQQRYQNKTTCQIDVVLQADPYVYFKQGVSLLVCHGGLNSIREGLVCGIFVLVLGLADIWNRPDEFERTENGHILERLGVGALQLVTKNYHQR